MAMCSRAAPPFSMSVLSPAISVVFTTAAFLLLQHFDASFGGQQDAGWGLEHFLGADVQQEDSGGDMAVFTPSMFSIAQQLLVQVSPEMLVLSFAQQSSLVLPMQEVGATVLFELLLPHPLVSDFTGVNDVQHEVVGFGFAGADDEQHEPFGFEATITDGEPQESVGFCSSGADEEQQDLDAFES